MWFSPDCILTLVATLPASIPLKYSDRSNCPNCILSVEATQLITIPLTRFPSTQQFESESYFTKKGWWQDPSSFWLSMNIYILEQKKLVPFLSSSICLPKSWFLQTFSSIFPAWSSRIAFFFEILEKNGRPRSMLNYLDL